MSLEYPVAQIRVKESMEVAYLNSAARASESFGMSQVLISGLCIKISLSAQFAHAVYPVEYLTSYSSVGRYSNAESGNP